MFPFVWRFARGSSPFLSGSAAVLCITLFIADVSRHPVLLGLAFVTLFATWVVWNFFRDPDRRPEIPPDLEDVPAERLVLAPADGRVVVQEDLPRGESVPLAGGTGRRMSIFLSVWDVHAQRAPIAASVREAVYRPGRYLVAWNRKASEENEQTVLSLAGRGMTVVVKQIAGIVARRICLWVRPGQSLAAGERLGFIRFGSRVDLFVPREVRWTVSVGQVVRGGRTVVGVLRRPTRRGR